MAAGETFPPEVWEDILSKISDGTPLREICREDGMPSYRVFYNRMADDSDLAARFARARIEGFDAIAERTRETARGSGDSAGDVQRDKLIIETDLKLLAKWDPKRYGDRVAHELSGPNGGPLQTVTREMTADEAARAYRDLMG